MNRIQYVAREHWFELLISVLAIAGMLELVVGRGLPGAPATSLWFSVPAVAVLVLPLFACRRFPFAAPAAYWVMAVALTFVDGLLIPFIGSLGVVGQAVAHHPPRSRGAPAAPISRGATSPATLRIGCGSPICPICAAAAMHGPRRTAPTPTALPPSRRGSRPRAS